MPLKPVQRTSVADAVYTQLLDGVLSGELDAGEELPAERALTAALGVNRQAVREALQRLAAVGLVEIRHGGRTRVRDFHSAGGLGLLPRLLFTPAGDVDGEVAMAVMELRACLGTDAARRCAERASVHARTALDDCAARMVEAGDDLARVGALDLEFWDTVIDGAANIAYRLAYNSMRQTYEPIADLLATVLADELTDHAGRRWLVDAIAAADGVAAAGAAQQLLARGESGVHTLLTTLATTGTAQVVT